MDLTNAYQMHKPFICSARVLHLIHNIPCSHISSPDPANEIKILTNNESQLK